MGVSQRTPELKSNTVKNPSFQGFFWTSTFPDPTIVTK